MKPMTLVQMLTEWVSWRTEIERKACGYWIDTAEKDIRRLELLILAVDNRKLILESLDKDLEQDALEETPKSDDPAFVESDELDDAPATAEDDAAVDGLSLLHATSAAQATSTATTG